MPMRLLNILIVITRVVACTAVVPATLAASLLTVPVICDCGAGYPHPHPPFGSDDHYHGKRPNDADTEAARAATDGATVQTPAGSQMALLTAIPATSDRLQDLPTSPVLHDRDQIPDGRQDRPDIPPPRT